MYSVPPHSIRRPPTSLLEARIASITSPSGDPVGREPVGIHGDLVLLLEAADRGDLGHSRHRLQRVAQRPVLEGAQLVQRVRAGAVHQRVLEDPAHAGGIGTQLRRYPLGQPGLDLGEVLEHPRARPVDVGAVLEDHVHVGEAEVGEAANRLDLRRAEQRGDDRVGDLVFDDVGRAVPARVDDDLRVGQVRQRIQADPLQRARRRTRREPRITKRTSRRLVAENAMMRRIMAGSRRPSPCPAWSSSSRRRRR